MPRGKRSNDIHPVLVDMIVNPRDEKERALSKRVSRMTWKQIWSIAELGMVCQLAYRELTEGRTPKVVPIRFANYIAKRQKDEDDGD